MPGNRRSSASSAARASSSKYNSRSSGGAFNAHWLALPRSARMAWRSAKMRKRSLATSKVSPAAKADGSQMLWPSVAASAWREGGGSWWRSSSRPIQEGAAGVWATRSAKLWPNTAAINRSSRWAMSANCNGAGIRVAGRWRRHSLLANIVACRAASVMTSSASAMAFFGGVLDEGGVNQIAHGTDQRRLV